ncbi:MAG TPA: BlaI/MecI/CopY family transcriptional regulator [Candidatus Hydrogenedentes bacterium]|nr:BlaI/MecI/CopY family transcriptional regulator [Candidatus Hydrogenedentota bacterium]
MNQPQLPQPTDGELAILSVLWKRGPSTVRQVRDALDRARPTGYTTVLKLMQIMHEKGLLTRDESQRSHVYEPALAQEQTQGQLVRDLLDKAFGGSAHKLVMHALSVKHASAAELAEIRRLLDNAEGVRDVGD